MDTMFINSEKTSDSHIKGVRNMLLYEILVDVIHGKT